MARKPVHLEMAGGKEPRQRMWEAIRANRDAFTVYLIARRSGQDDTAVKNYLVGLRKAGYVAHVRVFKRMEVVTYHLVKDNGAEAPCVNSKGETTRANLGTEAIWRTLRILGGTAEQIAAFASASGTAVAATSVERYCAELVKAGYVTRSGGQFQLLPRRYTGPKPPIVQKRSGRQVYDPNLDRVIWTPGEGEAVPEAPELTWARIEIERLRAALAGLVGADSPDELRNMEQALRAMSVPAEDKAVTINAIHALLGTAPEPRTGGEATCKH